MSQPSTRTALITGASSGIGRATALELAAAGMTVLVNARRADELDKLVGEVEAAGGKAHALPGDAADPAALDRLWAEATDRAGGVPDVLVANAGRGLQGGVLSSDRETWESMFQLNVVGTMHLMRTAAAAMRDAPGSAHGNSKDIVVVGSVVGTNISPFSAVYGATKFAIESAAEALRREMATASGGVGPRRAGDGGEARDRRDRVSGRGGLRPREPSATRSRKFGPMLDPADVARVIRFAVEQPANVHVNQITVRPVGQDYP